MTGLRQQRSAQNVMAAACTSPYHTVVVSPQVGGDTHVFEFLSLQPDEVNS